MHADGGAGQKNLGEPHRYEGHHKIALKQSHWSRRELETTDLRDGTHGQGRNDLQSGHVV
jgi:hypothetical protein